MPVTALLAADSPRLGGEDGEHIRMLAEAGDNLPPIIVHRQTMRIVDGMHRLAAAVLRGDETIEVRFFDGTDREAFVLAVRANITHGRPLSPQDRVSAVGRIIRDNPEWSDRAIASAIGLGPSTVGSIRKQIEPHDDIVRGAETRVGRDGRRRPVDNSEGRRRAAGVIRETPDLPLREVARLAGVSPTTAQDVRKRLSRGDEPVLSGQSIREGRDGRRRRNARQVVDEPRQAGLEKVLEGLQRDPSLRFSESGRILIRWLSSHAVRFEDWLELSKDLPAHCSYVLADLARRMSAEWQKIANELQIMDET
ncbi:ParB N-terminal domain-containing protein [Dactylosporangium roseum]